MKDSLKSSPRGKPNAAPLTVVIPTLNEAAALPSLLADLAAQTLHCQIIVADGGSGDRTAQLAEAQGVVVVSSPRGRGAQMNAGAALAASDLLLFLHADTRLTTTDQLALACSHLEAERSQHGDAVAGHFALHFDRSALGHERLFRFMEAKTASNRPGTVNGDQGLLITRTYFDRLGGFDARWRFFEDQRLAQRIFATGTWILLPGCLRTSARRFEQEGHGQRYALMAVMMVMHELGIERFFDEAPALYAEQSETGRLQLAPFLQFARALLVEACCADPALTLRFGRYVRGNAWQLPLLLDTALAARGALVPPGPTTRDSWLSRFDRRVAPRLDHPIADTLAAAWLAAVLLVTAPVGGFVRRDTKKKRPA